MPVQVAVTASGRMSLPADVRKRLGLGAGGSVYLDETADGVVLRTASQIVANARALAKQYADVPGASVTDFLDARAAESGE